MKNPGLCIVSVLGGAILGAALAMFLTPQSGQELRNSLRDYLDKEVDKVRCHCDEKHSL